MWTPSIISLPIIAVFLALAGIALDKLIMSRGLKEWRQDVVNLWLKLNTPDAIDLSRDANLLFCELFDRIYGRSHFKWRRVWTSIVSSFLGLIALTAIIGYEKLIWPEIFGILSEFFGLIFDIATSGNFGILDLAIEEQSIEFFLGIVVLILPILLNLIPDYFSLIETRIILEVSKGRGANGIVVLWFIDIALTTIIFLIGFLVFEISLFLIMGLEFDLSNFFSYLPDPIFDPKYALIFFLTTFVTSLFWFMFVMTYALICIFHRLSPVANFVYIQIGTSTNPASVISAMLIAFVCLFYSAWFGVAWAIG